MTSVQDAGIGMITANSVATIVIDRRHARNALLMATWCRLSALIAAAEDDPRVSVIILRGADGHFGAGNDIAEFARLRDDAAGARRFGWAMANAIKSIATASKPVIAAIEGCCHGGSVALALAADIRLASVSAHLAITPAKLGALYLRSDLHRLVAAIGGGRTRHMIYTGRSISARQAKSDGLVDLLVDDGEFDAEIRELARAIATGSTYTITHSKRMLRALGTGDAPEETEESIGWFVAAMQGCDFAEGVSAFLEKRPPRFSGGMEPG